MGGDCIADRRFWIGDAIASHRDMLRRQAIAPRSYTRDSPVPPVAARPFLSLTGCREDGDSARAFLGSAEGPAGMARKRQSLGRGPCSRGADHGTRPGSLLAPRPTEKLGKDDMKTPIHTTTCAMADCPIAARAPNSFRSETVAAERPRSPGPARSDATPAGPRTWRPETSPRGKPAETGVFRKESPGRARGDAAPGRRPVCRALRLGRGGRHRGVTLLQTRYGSALRFRG